MKNIPWLFLCLLAPLAGQAGLQDLSAQANGAVYDEVEAISRRAAAGTRNELAATLTRAYPAVTHLDVRETITVVLGLNAMVDRKDADAARYREHLRANFPNSRYQPLLEPSTNRVPCQACEATGRRKVPCQTCGGSGKCQRCSGRGQLPRMGSAPGTGMGLSTGSRSVSLSGGTVTKPIGGSFGDGAPENCIVCKGSGKCKGCDGQKTVEAPCPACEGRGQITVVNIRPVFSEMLVRLADLAYVSGQIARGRALFDGKWLEKDAFIRATRQRQEDLEALTRAAAEATTAENFARARVTLEQAVAKFTAEPLAWHARELLALLNRDEAARRKWGELADDVKMAVASAGEQIPRCINTVLETRRGGNQSPESLLAPDAAANLPAGPLAWRVDPPQLVGRTARVPVTIDCATPGGLISSLRWTFFMVHTESGWRIVRLDPA